MDGKITYTDVADYFIAFANDTHDLITNLKLQKLVYYVQAWHLAITGNKLFDNDFQAWVHGPVLIELYNDYHDLKWHPIMRDDLDNSSILKLEQKFGENVTDIIRQVINEYFELSAYQLERLTHSEDPWQKAREGLPPDSPSNNIIKSEWMSEYYKQYLDE